MKFVACQVSLAPLRADPSHKSEMTSQLLFGETAEVQDTRGNWLFVVCAWDGYTGWVHGQQVKPLTPSEYDQYEDHQAVNLSLVEGLMAADHFIPLTMGAVLPRFDGLRCQLGDQSYQFSGSVVSKGQIVPTGEWIIKLARRYLNAPYLWGGRSPFGIDCSGLTQMVYKIAGVRLLRDAYQQVTQGRTVDFTQQCQAGDLAFFDNGKGNIGHVGIVLPDCHVIHANGKVRIDKFDHFGIFSQEQKRYTHQLRIIKRMLPDDPEADARLSEKEASADLSANQFALFNENR
ncbi:MAG: C40 family peptidase [Saprospiraceae bacterium]|nr:C40 family peptidase [Saprospiraceae bacterium]